MGQTLTVATGYGLLVPLEASERIAEKYEDGLYKLLDDPRFNLLRCDMAYHFDYHQEDEPYEVIFIKSTVRTEYGVGVTKLRIPPHEGDYNELKQLLELCDDLGIDPGEAEVGYWTVVSYG